MTNPIAGPAASALSSLSSSQIDFIKGLSKAELHAHLNGSIPISCLQELARERISASEAEETPLNDVVRSGLRVLEREEGVSLERIDDFFTLFPAIYALTSTRECLMTATRAVLLEFLGPVESTEDPSPPECTYLELRTTPRDTVRSPEARGRGMTRREYLEAVLDEVERYGKDRAALIVSVDRRMSIKDVDDVVELAKSLKEDGRRVVGVDLCGDPLQGNMDEFLPVLKKVSDAGLGLTLHIAETTSNTTEDTNTLLACNPSRLGHATFLNEAEQATVLEKKMAIEICLTSNLLCKTVTNLKDHHIHYYLRHRHPITICTDDILPFRTSLTAEYALLLAKPPLGLGLSQDEVARIAEMSMESRFQPSA